jgi:hypothetical protein
MADGRSETIVCAHAHLQKSEKIPNRCASRPKSRHTLNSSDADAELIQNRPLAFYENIMADQTAKAEQTSKDKPFVFPDLTDYVVPSVEILLISGFGLILLNYILGWGLFSRDVAVSRNAVVKPAATAQSSESSSGPIVQSSTVDTTVVNPAVVNPAVVNPAQTAVVSGTHRALCATSDQGLNFRPAAGFSTPLFAIPCGGIMTVTGNAVNVENETWSPVNYAGRNGWAATKLLQPLR